MQEPQADEKNVHDITKQEIKEPEAPQLTKEQQSELEKGKEASTFVEELMETFEVETTDDLKGAVKEYQEATGKLAGLDIDDVLKKAKEHDQWTAYWAQQEEQQRRRAEQPQDTIRRLEKEMEGLKSARLSDEEARNARIEAEQALANYESHIKTFIESQEDIPENHRQFVSLIMGVKNPTLEIDIANKTQTQKAAKEVKRQYDKFVSAIIKDYRDGKLKIPPMSPEEKPVSTTPQDTKVKGLSDAKAKAAEFLMKRFGAK